MWVVYFVSSCCETGSVWVSFFRADGAGEAAVSDVFLPIVQDVTFMDEVDGVSAFDPITYTLCEATKFIDGRSAPCDFVFWVS